MREEIRAAFRESLIRGHYNLLLGSGVCLDSTNESGDTLPSADVLRTDLCAATGAPSNTTLSRVVGLLDDAQKKKHLTHRFRGCRPGPSLIGLTRYLWRRLFSFNIDDVVEALYEQTADAKQTLVPLNFNALFEPTPDKSELLGIHLHGWVRKPDAGYVFATSEYVRVMKGLNPWMHLLSEILATEPFIIAGTSLNEVDLEYYLSFRSKETPRRDRGPSILVQPNPDVVIESDCSRYGLELFPHTFEEFLSCLRQEVPSPPKVHELIVPDSESLFATRPSSKDLLTFFSDFELVQAANRDVPATPTGFLYGREPKWSDIDCHLDVERQANAQLFQRISLALDDTTRRHKPIVILDDAGAGKTTTARRVVHDLVEGGVPVISASTTSRLDPLVAARCLKEVAIPVVVFVDGIADHAEQVAQLVDDPEVGANVVFFATERGYRREYLSMVFGASELFHRQLNNPTKAELEQLLERYRRYALVGTHTAMQRPRDFVGELTGDPIAVAVCRIMNDFQPLERIIESLWDASDQTDRRIYLCVALAQHCIKAGLKYSLLQTIAGPGQSIAHMFEHDIPLGLARNTVDDDYVVAANGVVAERILLRAAHADRSTVENTFQGIGHALAPHVNRTAIMKRSPEARLAGRLFDSDKVVRPFLGDAAQAFFVAAQPLWTWNSRYWEQRALLVVDSDCEAAVAYARHAVAIELHQYPLTTLGKVLLKQMENVAAKRDESFAEALKQLDRAIEREFQYTRITIHPYVTLLGGTAKYLELGGQLAHKQKKDISVHLEAARTRFRDDAQMGALIDRLDNLM